MTLLTILLGGFRYLSIAMPWILYQKQGKRLFASFAAMSGFIFDGGAGIKAYLPVAELFSFIRQDFHPDHLVDEPPAVKIQ